jgi:transcriptional regulator with XRE-family HTH domain
LLILLGKQLRAARVLLGWSQIDLAKRARVAIGTIRRMESFEGEIVSYTSTLSKVAGAMEKAGISFLNGAEPGVRLKKIVK